MKTNHFGQATAALIFTGALLFVPALSATEQAALDTIAASREELSASRKILVEESMQLSLEEGNVFWPIYGEYRAVVDRVNDRLLVLMREYADAYPKLPEERAEPMLKEYSALEKKRVEARVAYLNQVAKALTSAKAMRLAQIENRLDLDLLEQLTSIIPLVPHQSK